MKPTSQILRRVAHLRFARAKRWITDAEPSSFNAYVALCEALFWRNRAQRRECAERSEAARERLASIEAAMKDPSHA